MRKRLASVAALVLVVGAASMAQAEVTPGSLFTDHAVLQRGAVTAVWGTAGPGEKVAVMLNGQTQNGTADGEGKWRVELRDLQAGGPYELTMEGANRVTLKDVYVGEVWLASGQSNMDFSVAKTAKRSFAGVRDQDAEIAAANHPLVRMYCPEWAKRYTPQSTISGAWKVCTPENVGDFSAVGYFFERDLQKELNVPVGVVMMTFGASTAQSWIRREALLADPRTAPLVADFDALVEKAKNAPATESAASAPGATEPGATTKPRAKRPPKDPVQDQHNPTVMYNGMIAPMVGYGIRGVIWYQGESITGDKAMFPLLNSMLIEDWRKLWKMPEMPFYFCQLAALKAASNSPEVRAMQAEALKIPHTAMAVTIDIGDAKSVHPKNKQDVGDRLCRIALANVYGEKIEYRGPVAEAMTVEGANGKVTFSHAEGLMAKGGELKTFEIAGADAKFVTAEATVEGNAVVVKSPAVKEPVTVRYAWSNYPEGCNLYNGAGLPAAPFELQKK